MVVHGFLSPHGISCLKRSHDAAMFIQRLLQTPFQRERVHARHLEHLAQILNYRKHPAIVGKLLDTAVKLLISLEKRVNAPFFRRLLQLLVNGFQGSNICLGSATHGVNGATPLQHRHQRENVVDILIRNFGDITTTPWLELNQTFRGEHLERFA